MNQVNKITALYCRLSRDDAYHGDSLSIMHQKDMLVEYAKLNGFENMRYYVDDGYAGTSFERPDFEKLESDIEKGMVSTIITKDLSRLGRDYLKTGFYIENYFPSHKVRFIAINDGVDSHEEANDFTPFKNIINEWYAKDISKKIKSAYRSKALKGEFTGAYAPYGYQKDPNNKYKLIIDTETSVIVKRIFDYALEGITPFKIASILKKEGILKPRAKMMKDLGKYASEKFVKYPYDWSHQTIHTMLKNREYLGHIVCNKHASKSFKDRSLIKLPKEAWIEVKNTHEALVDEKTFNEVQKIISIRKRLIKSESVPQIFVGLLRCADCGKTLSFSKNKNRKGYGYYACSTFRHYGKLYCSAHYITYENLYDVVLKDIKKQIHHAKLNEEELLNQIQDKESLNTKYEVEKCKKEIIWSKKRIETLDVIIKQLYEDNVIGKIDNQRFNKLLSGYDAEQKELNQVIDFNTNKMIELDSKKENIKDFMNIIKKYTEIKELDLKILNEFIEKIVVHEVKKEDHIRKQQIDIHYKFIGKLATE